MVVQLYCALVGMAVQRLENKVSDYVFLESALGYNQSNSGELISKVQEGVKLGKNKVSDYIFTQAAFCASRENVV